MSAELKASRRDATLILTLSDPGTGNALHPDMTAAAIETLSTAERDDDIRAVVLTGAGGDFCSGNPPSRWLDNRPRDGAHAAGILDLLQGWIDAIQACPKPVIAAVEGNAAGAGVALALACDLIVAGASARFALPGVTMGLPPEGGASWFVTQALPRHFAAELLLDGGAVGAERLHTLGVVNRLVADGNAVETALAWADKFAARSAEALELTKSLMHDAGTQALAQQIAAEKQHFIESLHSANTREALSAFLEQRPPRFK